MTPEKSPQTGRFVKESRVRPAVEVDCSTWDTGDSTVPWTTGRCIKRSRVRPAVEVDCSGWSAAPTVSLELEVYPDPGVDAVQLALSVIDLLAAVNKLDRALGGTGLTKVAGQQINGAMTITLAPEQPAGAVDRIRQICNQVNRATPTAAEFSLPACVKIVRARTT